MTPLTETIRAWSRVSDHVVSSMVEANKATFAAFGVTPGLAEEYEPGPEPVPSVAAERVEWSFDRTVTDPASIEVGDTVTFAKTITDEDVQEFAYASGDTNRLHLDEDFASETRFGGRIAHGTLVAGLVSAALARIPGLTVYLSQDLEFLAPVSIGDRVSATVEVVESLGGDRYRLETNVSREDELVVDGEAVVLIDSVPAADSDSTGRDDVEVGGQDET